MTVLDRALSAPRNLSSAEIAELLADGSEDGERRLFAAAGKVKAMTGRTATLPRGLVECSNVCAKDCHYCGIRRSRREVERYAMEFGEVCDCIADARRRGYPAMAFQSGEVESEANTRFYERILAECRGLEVTLSLGEQTESVYRRWREAGALRYLLRIETSCPDLYASIHPPSHSFVRRLECIRTLKRLGYVTGTGVMIGLPGQTVADLARDIIFFGDENVDMVGMGPYLPCAGTPLAAKDPSPSATDLERRFRLALRMIAVARIYLWHVNIVAATALEALSPRNGRVQGVAAGANVVMDNLTPDRHRAEYALYPGKP